MRAFRCPSCALRCESAVSCREFSTISASVTTHHDLLREDELVDFSALLPRPDDELDDDFLAAGRCRLVDEALEVDFFAVVRGRLVALGVLALGVLALGVLALGVLARLEDVEPAEDLLDEDLRPSSDPPLPEEPRDDVRLAPCFSEAGGSLAPCFSEAGDSFVTSPSWISPRQPSTSS